jgi:DNA-binding Lrp family transcriptional regulator
LPKPSLKPPEESPRVRTSPTWPFHRLEVPPAKAPNLVIEVSRSQARIGQICNPWLGDARYCPLPDHVAERKDLTAGDKKLFAAILYRIRMCRGRLPIPKLAEETLMTKWKVCERIRKLVKKKVLKRKFGLLTVPESKVPSLAQIKTHRTFFRENEGSDEEDAAERLQEKREAGEFESRIPKAMLACAFLTDPAVILYARLTSLAGKKGFWFGQRVRLQRACGISHDLLAKATQELEDEKLILVSRGVHRVPRRHGGGVNEYRFLGHKLFQGLKDV